MWFCVGHHTRHGQAHCPTPILARTTTTRSIHVGPLLIRTPTVPDGGVLDTHPARCRSDGAFASLACSCPSQPAAADRAYYSARACVEVGQSHSLIAAMPGAPSSWSVHPANARAHDRRARPSPHLAPRPAGPPNEFPGGVLMRPSDRRVHRHVPRDPSGLVGHRLQHDALEQIGLGPMPTLLPSNRIHPRSTRWITQTPTTTSRPDVTADVMAKPASGISDMPGARGVDRQGDWCSERVPGGAVNVPATGQRCPRLPPENPC